MYNPAKKFEDLIVWQKAHAWVLDIYRNTKDFPNYELYGLTSQLRRRSAISEPANIAEGFKKRGKPDKIRFYNIAQGSLEESHYYLILARDLEYIDSANLINQVAEIGQLLESYIQSIRNSSSSKKLSNS